MKRTLLALLLTAIVSVCFAQNTKQIDNKIKQFDKSAAVIADPSKANDPNALISHANLLIDMNCLYTSSLYQQMDMVFTPTLIGKPIGPTEDVTFGEITYQKFPFTKFDLYTIDNQIVFWVNKAEAHPGALQESFDLLVKAKNADPGQFVGSGKGAIAVDRLKTEYQTDAMADYRQLKFETAGEKFIKAAESSELSGVFDTLSYYYAGLCMASADNKEKSLELLKKVYDSGYSNGGDLENLLANMLTEQNRSDEALSILEAAISKYPTNEDILFTSINAFIKAQKDPKMIIETIKIAQKSDPSNASLYLVEGKLYKQLGDTASYYASLNKVVELDSTNCDPYFEFAENEINESNAIYREAEKLPLNDTKGYEEKMKQRYEHLEKAAAYYEKTLTKFGNDVDVIATLRQIYYQLRGKNDAAIDKKYEEYNNKYKELSGGAEPQAAPQQ